MAIFVSSAGSADDSSTATHVQNSLSVCLGEQHLTVPLVPQLQIIQPDGSLRDFRSLERMNSDQIQKILDSAPLKAKTIVLGSPGNSSSQRPLLDTLYGQRSPYKIRELRLYSGLWQDFDTWMGNFPSDSTTASGTHRFTPRRADFFERPIKATCFKGLPPSSNDPESRHCSIIGLSQSDTSVIVSFDTGRDLEGYWPTLTSDWKTLEMFGWSGPLTEIEDALQSIQVSNKRKEKCN